ncbi:hypothetical protein FACS1894218_4450 [Bacilli bacterium]|nr:hypothetical protein FACS1894218_4450 [Bacilli bacterium]
MLRLFVALSGRTLAMDFPSAGRDLDIPNDTNLADFNTASYANVTQLQIRDIITSLTENSNLNKNQINIAYGPDKDSLTTITSDIGPNQASLVNNA